MKVSSFFSIGLAILGFICLIVVFLLQVQILQGVPVKNIDSTLFLLEGNRCNKSQISSIAGTKKENFYIDNTVEYLTIPTASNKQIAHLFSHGKPGYLFIENQWRDAVQIASWIKFRRFVKNKAHLNIYGCNFAKGEKGRAALAYLEKELGISIAASDDITGVDGDWVLEVGMSNTSLKVKDYQHNLQDCSLIDVSYCPPSSPTANDGTITITNMETAVPGANFWKVDYKSDECGIGWTGIN